MAQFKFIAIGTGWKIDIFDDVSPRREAEILKSIMSRIYEFDKVYSRFRSDSLVTQMAKTAGTYTLPPDTRELFTLYREAYDLTAGLVTPLIGNVLSNAGYDAQYSLKQRAPLVTPPTWDEAMEFQPATDGEAPKLIMMKPVLLDFGAAGKGYLIDLVGRELDTFGLKEYSIDAGGDILHKGTKPLRVGLENPLDTKQVIGIYPLLNDSICGSAGNRRTWGQFTHIINPETLSSPLDINAVWVTASTAFLADILTTCLFFVRPEKMLTKYQFEYLIVRSDQSYEKSAGFMAEMFAK